MNEEQKEYSLIRIKKYKLDVENLDKKTEKNRTFLYSGIAIAVLAFVTANSSEEVKEISKFIYNTIGFAGVASIIENLKEIIYKTSKKAGLENEINRIEYEVEMSKLDENNDKGVTRR